MPLILLVLACAPDPPPPAVPPPAFTSRRDPSAPVPGAGRSLVVVIGCTVRADQTSVHGGPAATTPFLASLAAEGLVFDDAVAAAPWTRPAVTTLFTGRHALTVGMADPDLDADDRRLADDVATLASHLGSRGWTTVGVSANPNVHSRYGLDRGFQRWSEPAGAWRPADGADGVKLPGELVAAELRTQLEGLPEGPVFVAVVLVDAHSPYAVRGADLSAFADPAAPDEVVVYRSALRRFDDAARAVVGAARSALPDDPLVVVVSDHGDALSFPAHHGLSHGRFLAPSVVRAVWIAAGPDVVAGRVPGTVSQVDVAPTLAAAVGAPGLVGEGRALAGALRGEPVVPQPAFADTWFREVDRAAVYTPDRACQVDLSGAPPRDGFVDGCFDRTTDPTHLARIDDPALIREVLAFRAARPLGEGTPAAPRPELDDALRALGYVDDLTDP